MLKKKKISIILIAILILTTIFTFFCGFTYENLNGSDLVVSEDEVAEFALSWQRANYQNFDNIKIKTATIYNLDETVYGYYTVFSNNTGTLGYLITNSDKTSENIVIEYALEGGCLFEIINYAKLYRYNECQYGYDSEQMGSQYFNRNDYKTDYMKIKEKKVKGPDIYEGINDMDLSRELLLYGENHYVNYNMNYSPYLMSDFARRLGEGNCVPTALVNLAYLYQCMGYPMLLNGNAYTTYNKMVELSGYDYRENKDGLAMSKGTSTFEKYTKGYTNYKADVFKFVGDFWGYFKDHIDRGNPILTSISGKDPMGENWGHAVVAYGYVEYVALVFPGQKFLIVADGWYNTSERVLNFDYYTDIDGYRVKI